MARAIWSGAISFGLVNIPVKLFTATRDKSVHFHQLHAKDRSRVRHQTICAAEDKPIGRDQIVKGYSLGGDRYVVVEPEELNALSPEASRNIEIIEFVDLREIDPVYYDRPYYLAPDEQAARPYQLLVEAMRQAGKVAIAKFVMRDKEYLAAIRPIDGVLCVETMRYADEIVPPAEVGATPAGGEVNERELKMARQLVESLSGDFEPEKFHDEHRQRVEELIARKSEGVEVPAAPPPSRPAPVINLLDALEQSLAQAKKRGGKKKEPVGAGGKKTA